MDDEIRSYDEIMGRYLTDAEFHAEVEATCKLLQRDGRHGLGLEDVATVLHTRDTAVKELNEY